MNTSELEYQGELRTIATHVFSGTSIFTDAPLDNHGKAQSFSPTDLLATALASCMITVMGIEANKHNIDLTGTKLFIQKQMAINPRRVSKVIIHFDIKSSVISEKEKSMLEDIALNCPVAKSINTEIKQEITFSYL